MNKLTRYLALALVCLALLACPAQAADFADVAGTHWGAAYIQQCYEKGLMVGTGERTFSPGGTVTVAQAVTAAVRTRRLSTGSTGQLAQTGEHWYDSAVSEALRLGIMTSGQFDSYTRPATRAELAGLLGRALPGGQYQAINTVESLPDVTQATPYAQEIWKLYRAGILTGNDRYGSFAPDQDITRVELAALLCRLISPELRVSFTLAPKPADTTVRTSACRLLICGIPVYGVVEMDGKYYIPGEILGSGEVLPERLAYVSVRDGECSVQLHPDWANLGNTYVAQSGGAAPGITLGRATLSRLQLVCNREALSAPLYELDGRYPLIPLEALGAVKRGSDLVLYPEYESRAFTAEADLVGDIPATLRRDTPRATVIAIHDYLVQRLTYDPRVSMKYTTEAENHRIDALWAEAETQYEHDNNLVLATGYGVCQNYAELFQSFCSRLGIPCCLVSGAAGGGGHAWNAVYIEGQWLYVDCTFDDPIGKTPRCDHTYCLVGPEVLVKDHCWSGSDYPLPEEYDPAWEQLDPNAITGADMFRKCLVAQLMQKKEHIRLRVTVSGGYGGLGCIHKYRTDWASFSGGYNAAAGCYEYEVTYWDI